MKDEALKTMIKEAVKEAIADASITLNADGWMTKQEAAAHLRMSVSTINKLIAAKRIPFHAERRGTRKGHRGSSPIFRKSEIDQWMMDNSHAQKPRDFKEVFRRIDEQLARDKKGV